VLAMLSLVVVGGVGFVVVFVSFWVDCLGLVGG